MLELLLLPLAGDVSPTGCWQSERRSESEQVTEFYTIGESGRFGTSQTLPEMLL